MKMCLANAMGSIYVGERDLLLESKLVQVHPLNMTVKQHFPAPSFAHKGSRNWPYLLQALEPHPKGVRDIMGKLTSRDTVRNYLPCSNGLTWQPFAQVFAVAKSSYGV